ncbi:MAG: hypothetical protein HFE73_10515 [Firmicutes bacterium]|nr:hypothetical protein [Bacillota bacterium]
MKAIRIVISMKEMGFAQAMARGLAEAEEQLQITILSAEEGTCLVNDPKGETECESAYQILVTDLDVGLSEFWQKRAVRLESYAVSVKEIIHRVMEMVYPPNRTESAEEKVNGRRPFIIGFYGVYGSCGLTSIAVTTGRILAGGYGEKVVYLSFTPQDDGQLYDEPPYDGQGENSCGDRPTSKKELMYRLQADMHFYLPQYVTEDRYGLAQFVGTGRENSFSIIPRKEQGGFLQRLAGLADYDIILVDLGVSPSVEPGLEWGLDYLIEVRNRQDKRWEIKENMENGRPEPTKKLILWNRGNERHIEEDKAVTCHSRMQMEIMEDKESFQVWKPVDCETAKESSQAIAVSMTRDFAEGVKKLANFLEEIVLKAKRENSEGPYK